MYNLKQRSIIHVSKYMRMIFNRGAVTNFVKTRDGVHAIRALKKIKRSPITIYNQNWKPYRNEDTYKHSGLIVKNKKFKPGKPTPTFTLKY